MSFEATLSPFVYWNQTSDSITLRVDLRNVASPSIVLKDESLNFYTVGVGAKGRNEYAFCFEFFEPVNPEKSYYKISDRNVEFVIEKRTTQYWPRLPKPTIKYPWIRVDFDKMKDPDSSSSGEESEVDDYTPAKSVSSHRFTKDKNFGRGRKNRSQDFRTAYLSLYNLFQFVGFIYIFVIFIIHYFKEGPGTIQTIYRSIRFPIKFLDLMQLLEIVHPVIGYTNGNAVVPFVQWFGRSFFIFCLVDQQVQIQSHYATFYLLLVYTISELFRYPYYMLHIYKVDIRFVTWLRYSAWVVLYPLGFLFECIIVYNSIPLLEESGAMSVFLPNAANWSFYMPTLLRLYINLLTFPVFCFIMSHMYRQRKKTLNVHKKKKKIH